VSPDAANNFISRKSNYPGLKKILWAIAWCILMEKKNEKKGLSLTIEKLV
jgi:hypothetical protein